MKGKIIPAFLVMLFLLMGIKTTLLYGGDWRFGLGVNLGVSKLEGDLPDASLSPLISGHIRAMPFPYLALSGELGFSALGSSSVKKFETTIIPFELSAIFNLLPFSHWNPYLFVGGGGVFWNATFNNATLDEGTDSFLKTGGGIEYRVSRSIGFNLGATFRLSLTDGFDQLWQGDENDQVLDVHGGITYYFGGGGSDRDHDNIPDEFDLMPEIAEDRDGYFDHDGIPEKNPSPVAMNSYDAPFGNGDQVSPIVIHKIIDKAESGRSISVKANVYSKIQLKVVAALYRPKGTRKWNVAALESNSNDSYKGEIPGYAVTTDGFEYCVVAVDETLTGVGYSGLPSKPINVTVSSSGTPWRIVGGTVGAASVGTASYLILRKQE